MLYSPIGVCARAGGRAGFLEQQALRSLAGGNVAAAIHRLGLCKEALLEECRASGYNPELCCWLGNVIGTQVRQHACTRRPELSAIAGGPCIWPASTSDHIPVGRRGGADCRS